MPSAERMNALPTVENGLPRRRSRLAMTSINDGAAQDRKYVILSGGEAGIEESTHL